MSKIYIRAGNSLLQAASDGKQRVRVIRYYIVPLLCLGGRTQRSDVAKE